MVRKLNLMEAACGRPHKRRSRKTRMRRSRKQVKKVDSGTPQLETEEEGSWAEVPRRQGSEKGQKQSRHTHTEHGGAAAGGGKGAGAEGEPH